MKKLLIAELLMNSTNAFAADEPRRPTIQERKQAAHDLCIRDIIRELATAPFIVNAKTEADREMAARLALAAAVDHCWDMRVR